MNTFNSEQLTPGYREFRPDDVYAAGAAVTALATFGVIHLGGIAEERFRPLAPSLEPAVLAAEQATPPVTPDWRQQQLYITREAAMRNYGALALVA